MFLHAVFICNCVKQDTIAAYCTLWFQAAVSARKPYTWVVESSTDGAGGVLLARLLTVIDGCVTADPVRRWTVPHVLDALTTLHHDALSASGAVVSGGASPLVAGGESSPVVVVAPPPLPAVTRYDVLAIVSAMEALGMDSSVVIDAIGGMTSSSLDALRAAGVSYSKCLAVKQALTASPTSEAAVKVRMMSCGLCRGYCIGGDVDTGVVWCS